jgi:hypothetical protein
MSTNQLRFAGAGLFFLFIFLSGYWLSRSGKPYSAIILAVHKLISLAAVVLLGVTIRRINQAGTLSTVGLLAAIVTGLFFLGTIITGGLLSIDKTMPAVIRRLHQVTPYLTVLSTAATLYLLSRR